MSVSLIPATAQTDKYVSTGYSKLRQGAWDKEWIASSDAGFVINRDSGEIRFDHTTWASHSLKINRAENSQTEEGGPLTIYHCAEPANGDRREVKINEWTVFDEAGCYHYYQIELKSPDGLMRFMTRKSEV